ncbi:MULTISPECIES: hypothetical protein [Methylorubrum]|uniref:hypothetical protein n=1 Tax=Methylorubrum TaxID=2282523 RepID=UPI0020A08413|nr:MULTISPECIES: hypothetical protein [Methylorubrum]MCP1549713.1 hypothetical protein [Methylorubrum zatmanii]MCP1553673.1 hypothetical protein [Methylorubrum extorquens]MCP1580015.1 hypothetical protein [Methylorubrum extorquens]
MALNRILPPEDCARHVSNLLLGPEPAFLGRLGGVDTNAAVFTQGTSSGSDAFLNAKKELEIYTGYYDTCSDTSRVPEFLSLLTKSYRASDTLSVGHAYLIAPFFPEIIDFPPPPETAVERCEHWVREVIGADRNMTLIPYNFIERLVAGGPSLLSVFSEALVGKKVLAITPFSETIQDQHPNRHQFFKNYEYPEFDLLTYTTPITYHGLPAEFFPDQDWFSTLERMKREITAIDFDIALLACASYATPLGAFIQDDLGKKAVYVGGVLQLFFGIMGRRFNTTFYNSQINPGIFVRPREAQKFIEKVNEWSDSPTEAFGAYF